MVGPIFLDTSLLVSGLIDFGGELAPAQQIMTLIADGDLRSPHTAWHCCLEFYAVATRLPEDLRLSPGDALRLLDHEVLARFSVHQLPAEARGDFLSAAARERLAGGRIYDAHIAEVARSAKARLVVTDNRRHFISLLRHGIRVVTGAEFVEEFAPGSD